MAEDYIPLAEAVDACPEATAGGAEEGARPECIRIGADVVSDVELVVAAVDDVADREERGGFSHVKSWPRIHRQASLLVNYVHICGGIVDQIAIYYMQQCASSNRE